MNHLLTIHVDASVIAWILSGGAFVEDFCEGSLKAAFIDGPIGGEFHPQFVTRRFNHAGRSIATVEELF